MVCNYIFTHVYFLNVYLQTTEIILEMKKRYDDDVVQMTIARTRGSRISYTRQKTSICTEL